MYSLLIRFYDVILKLKFIARNGKQAPHQKDETRAETIETILFWFGT